MRGTAVPSTCAGRSVTGCRSVDRLAMKLPDPSSILQRIEIDPVSQCWIWIGYLSKSPRSSGYGLLGKRYAHRLSFQVFVGAIPDGYEIDHLCHSYNLDCPGGACLHRRCVNPSHLEPVTRQVNLLRGRTFAAVNAAKTHCPQGHPYSGGNLVIHNGGRRRCRQCHNDTQRRYIRRKGEQGQ